MQLCHLPEKSSTFYTFVVRSFAEMQTQREKSATPTRDHVSSAAAAAVAAGQCSEMDKFQFPILILF